jgi:hypothetical protein
MRGGEVGDLDRERRVVALAEVRRVAAEQDELDGMAASKRYPLP